MRGRIVEQIVITENAFLKNRSEDMIFVKYRREVTSVLGNHGPKQSAWPKWND